MTADAQPWTRAFTGLGVSDDLRKELVSAQESLKSGNAHVGWTPPANIHLTLVFLGWATWALTSLTDLLKTAGVRLTALNEELRDNQQLLEQRIEERTRELQHSQALLVQQEKQAAFGLLAAGIAHEVGNPLASISSIVQMLSRRHEDDYTRERLSMVHEQEGVTTLVGPVADQAALYGIIVRLRDMGLKLLDVQRMETDTDSEAEINSKED